MVYRDDVGALEARLTTLESELVAKTRQRDEAARLLIEAKARANNDALAADWAAGGPLRRRRHRVALVISSLMALTAAIGLFVRYHARDRKAERVEAVIVQFESYTDEMCVCRDTACAQAVSDRMTTWATDMAKEDPAPNPGDIDHAAMERMQKIGTRMGECMTKAMTPPPNPVD